jgi:rhodanese-related sulfurtransferase
MSELKTISPARAAELVRAGAVMIDIREADEHARERIPGARHHALSLIEQTAPIRNGDDVLIFHCRSGARTKGNAPKLAAAAQTCEAFILEGGLDARGKAGLPVALDRSQPIEIMRRCRSRPAAWCCSAWCWAHSWLRGSMFCRVLSAPDCYLPARAASAEWPDCWRRCRGTGAP